MGTTRIYFVAAVLLFVLNGACLVKGNSTATMTASYSTSDDNSTSGMTNGNTDAPVPPDNSDSGITCLVCLGGNNSNCNHDLPTSSMEGISVERGCRSCRIYKSDTGKGTNITQVERKCDQDDSCPKDLMGKDYFKCNDNATYRKCEWCCQKNNCIKWNSANALVAAVVLGGWTITKVVYVVVSAVAVAISMSTMV